LGTSEVGYQASSFRNPVIVLFAGWSFHQRQCCSSYWWKCKTSNPWVSSWSSWSLHTHR